MKNPTSFITLVFGLFSSVAMAQPVRLSSLNVHQVTQSTLKHSLIAGSEVSGQTLKLDCLVGRAAPNVTVTVLAGISKNRRWNITAVHSVFTGLNDPTCSQLDFLVQDLKRGDRIDLEFEIEFETKSLGSEVYEYAKGSDLSLIAGDQVRSLKRNTGGSVVFESVEPVIQR